MSVADPKLDVLLDIELPVTLRFGRTQMLLGEVMALGSGSVIEFDRAVDEPVEVLVNGRVIARGETVMVQGNYAVRVSEIASRRERLDSTSPTIRNVAPGLKVHSQE
jgi:flagellar motor switch protein FliN/FliY